MKPRHVTYIGLGSNLGDRRANLLGAVTRLRDDPGTVAICLSSVRETEAVGGPPGQDPYLNAAASLTTTHDPESLLRLLQRIEAELGRKRTDRWGPRTIDLDLLLYDDRVIDTPELTVPHPRMHERRFVLEPLAEIAADELHPVLRLTIRELLQVLIDPKFIALIEQARAQREAAAGLSAEDVRRELGLP
jgi:2-amino-4-hydroxy-6-hydroxymethyldihydropteridine diphosphokinase